MNRNYLVLAICIALSITTIAVFWQVGNHEFISFDDHDYVTENRHVQGGLTLKGIGWAFSEPHAHNWHPLTWLSHMLDCQVFGLKPGPHHPADAHYNLGTTLASEGKLDEVVDEFRESIRISPDYAKAHNNLGNALLYQGRLDEAIASCREALRLNPDYTIAQENLKNASAVQKNFR